MVHMEMKKKQKQHRKGLWSPDEDEKLRSHILEHGHASWSSIPLKIGLERNGKSCRLRWINYLRPGLRRDTFTLEEEDKILRLHATLGNKWSQMAQHLPGRTDNEIKNHWHSNLKKRVDKHSTPQTSICDDEQRSFLPKFVFADWLTMDIQSYQLTTPDFDYNNIVSSHQNESQFQLDFIYEQGISELLNMTCDNLMLI